MPVAAAGLHDAEKAEVAPSVSLRGEPANSLRITDVAVSTTKSTNVPKLNTSPAAASLLLPVARSNLVSAPILGRYQSQIHGSSQGGSVFGITVGFSLEKAPRGEAREGAKEDGSERRGNGAVD